YTLTITVEPSGLGLGSLGRVRWVAVRGGMVGGGRVGVGGGGAVGGGGVGGFFFVGFLWMQNNKKKIKRITIELKQR
ncbi:hypothetical protein, partial [Shewanella sp. CAL98-MNA-CIBAN-0140]|uniref:hypothetical protein n=1 Tax=Shewanella sp. CAL98-MNA-CIBAN-0140 TaxID=3140462 RepID=UPI003320688E